MTLFIISRIRLSHRIIIVWRMGSKKKKVSLSVGRGEKSRSGGLTKKGREKYNRATGK